MLYLWAQEFPLSNKNDFEQTIEMKKLRPVRRRFQQTNLIQRNEFG